MLDNHKAFLYDPQRKLAGFPATIRTASGARVGEPWSGDRTVTFSGYLLVKVNEDGFELYGTLPSEEMCIRDRFSPDARRLIELCERLERN